MSEIPQIEQNFKSSRRPVARIDYSLLLELIKNHPIIYDIQHPDHGKEIPLNEAWKSISSQMNYNGLLIIFFKDFFNFNLPFFFFFFIFFIFSKQTS